MAEWKEYRLDEFLLFNPSERLPKGTTSKKIPMEALQPFTRDIPYYNIEEYKGGVKFRNGDTIMARITPSLENGKTSLVSILDDDEIGFGSTEYIVFRESLSISDSKFIYYLISSPDIRDVAILSMTGTSGRQRVQTDMLKELEIKLPPLAEQKAIAEVLSSLDDKIDLLHRQNKTLEQMAETLFRQWFVEEANESWESGVLGDIADHSKISINPSKLPNTYFYHYSLPAYDNNMQPSIESGEDIRSNKYQVIPNSILMSKLNPRFPRVWNIGKDLEDNAICSTEFQVVVPKDSNLIGYVYFLLKSDEVRGELEMSASGTSGSHQRVKPSDIFNIEINYKNELQIIEYSELVNDSLLKITTNQTQICTLEALRDTLLPKLMSGDVRVEF